MRRCPETGPGPSASAAGIDRETCIATRIKGWKFPKIGRGAITVSYPFIFVKEG